MRYFGDLGIRDPHLLGFIPDGLGAADRCPGRVADGGDGLGDGLVHPGGDRELGAAGGDGGDRVVVEVGAVSTHHDHAGRGRLAEGDQRVGDQPNRPAGGGHVAFAEPGGGDQGRTRGGRDGGHDRVQPFDLAVAVGGALLVVAVGFTDRVIHVHEADLAGTIQDRAEPGQFDEQAGSDRVELADVSEPVAAQVGAQGGGRPQPVEHPSHAAMAQDIHVGDRVGAGDHPRDQGGHLDRRVRPGRTWDRQVLGDQLVQACLFGDPHHGGQAAERDQIRVVENGLNGVADSHYECSCQASDENLEQSHPCLPQEHSPSDPPNNIGGSRLRFRGGGCSRWWRWDP